MGIHYFKIIDRKKWHQKKLPHSPPLSTMNSAAHTPLLCSMMMDSKSPLRSSQQSSRPQETPSSHTGQCSSPRPLRTPTLEISSLKSPQLVAVVAPVQTPVLAQPLKLKRRKKRKKKRLTSIWEVFSVTKMNTELSVKYWI